MAKASEHTTDIDIEQGLAAALAEPTILVGSKKHNMDSKGRVSLPSSFRKVFSGFVIVAPGQYKQVLIFSEANFKAWLDSMFEDEGGFNPRNRKHLARMHFFTTNSETVEIDKSGRIRVPDELREMAQLEGEVVIEGEYDHVSIWNQQRRDEVFGAYDPSEDFFQV